uniref:Uncharacterized protein n=1 Tax=Nelumbo nucifera TaxID=4432 RepID=A0A822ZQZ1_NELNU|nr:TPA_asm: hypothetical protein HUJ06_017589 [Nelumbo nucifera]
MKQVSILKHGKGKGKGKKENKKQKNLIYSVLLHVEMQILLPGLKQDPSLS